jgi:BMFP domain-containing protein YqiC
MVVGNVGTDRRDSPRSVASSADLVGREEYEALLLERLRAEYERLRARTASVVVKPLDLRTPF